MVLKTGPDWLVRPVELRTGHQFGPEKPPKLVKNRVWLGTGGKFGFASSPAFKTMIILPIIGFLDY